MTINTMTWWHSLIYHRFGLPSFWWESRVLHIFLLMKLEDAARSELEADPGIMIPLLDGSHLSSTLGKYSFQI